MPLIPLIRKGTSGAVKGCQNSSLGKTPEIKMLEMDEIVGLMNGIERKNTTTKRASCSPSSSSVSSSPLSLSSLVYWRCAQR